MKDSALMTYKLGKLPATPNRVALKFSFFSHKDQLPAAPATYSHTNLVPDADWGVLGNDQYGDCVWAGAGHETILWNSEAQKTVAFSTENTLSDYTAVTGFDPNEPWTDAGTNMSDAAEYRRKTGVLDAAGTRHQVAAYLAIEPGNLDELKQALFLFGAVGIGIVVTSDQQTQFANGEPWDVSDAPVEGGHYVPIVGYDADFFYVVTWGKVQKATYAFIQKAMDEGFVYLSEEALENSKSIDGFDDESLKKYLADL